MFEPKRFGIIHDMAILSELKILSIPLADTVSQTHLSKKSPPAKAYLKFLLSMHSCGSKLKDHYHHCWKA